MLILALPITNGWAQTTLNLSGEGSEQHPYEISSLEHWNNLADYVAEGNNCSGLFFLMTNDIGTAEAPVTKPLGRQTSSNKVDRKRFAGTFNGGNHTLTVALNSQDDWFVYNRGYCSPFAYVQRATIQNLHVVGKVIAEGQWASGLVGSTGNGKADGVCVIDHCQVSVEMVANYVSHNSSYGNHGGLVGIAEGNTTITNSWFDGKFLGVDYKYSAGFIGINKGVATLDNCLFNPSEINITNNNIEGSCEFAHDMQDGSHTLTNAYWVSHFGEPENAQGQRVIPQSSLPVEIQQSANFDYCVTTVHAADGNPYYIIKHNPTWMDVQTNFLNGVDMELQASIEAGTEDGALVVPAGKTVTLQLNGTLDRGLMLSEEAHDEGYVISVEEGASLTIIGGTLTGGNNTGHGGGVYNAGTLHLKDVTVSGNFAEGNGGGIYNGGSLVLEDVTITDNRGRNDANRGIGVYVADNAALNLQGLIQITGNNYTYFSPIAHHVAHNLYRNGVITLQGILDGQSSIGVEGTTGVFTNGLANYGDVSCFTSDDGNFKVVDESGEASLVELIKLTVAGFGNTDGKWIFVASPVVRDLGPKEVGNFVLNRPSDYDLYRFNQEAEAEWENYKNAEHTEGFVLENGKGYLYARKNKGDVVFQGPFSEETETTVELAYNESATWKGWNLVGNPFPVPAYVNRNYYKMNAEGTGVEPVNVEENDAPIDVCMGIMVQAGGSGETVVFSTTPFERQGGDRGNLSIVLSQNTRGNAVQDKAIVSFNEGNRLGKFYFGNSNANLYIPQGEKEFAIADAEKQGEMPLNFKAKMDGEYTISVDPGNVEMDYLHLIDHLTGADVDLLANPSYTFSAKADGYAARFRLVFSANNAQEMADENETFAFISDGNLIVNGTGTLQVFDALGHQLLTKDLSTANCQLSTANFNTGVYTLRLIKGGDMKTQKILVR